MKNKISEFWSRVEEDVQENIEPMGQETEKVKEAFGRAWLLVTIGIGYPEVQDGRGRPLKV